MAAGADRTSPQSLSWLRAAATGAVALWVVADLVEWGTGAPTGSTGAVVAHVLHLLGDVTFIVAVWTLAHRQRPVRQRGELIETLLVLLGVTVPLWLLWVRPNVAQIAATTAGGAAGVAIHRFVLFVLVGFVIWYVVGDVWIDRQSETLRAVLVVLVVLDLGPPFPGGGDPITIVVVLEVVRLALAVGLAVATYRVPTIATPRPVGRRHWQPDRVRLLMWAVIALVGPVVLAGGVMAGTQDLHVIAVAVGATVVGVALLSLREWTLLQDVGTHAGRQQRRADRHATLTRRISAREDARTAFLRAASHDLRTPLMAIRGSAELLATRDDELDPARRQLLLSTMNRNAERLEQMLASLLDVERLTAGTVQARHETVDVGEVARIVAALPHLRDEPIEVRPARQPVQVDRLMVERIIENLVTNAVRHTPPETPVWVDLERRDDGGLTLTVSDAGPGIPPEDRARAFEEFTRLERGAGGGGSGLGLSLVSRFAALHDGTVHLDERPGGGARFVVELPGPGDGGTTGPAGPTAAAPAYPLPEQLASRLETTIATAVDDEQAVDRAVRVMLEAETVEEVAGVLERIVRYLGGVPIRLTGDEPLTPRGLDLALGLGPPVVPAAAPGTDARRRLAPLLPGLVDDAHRIAALLRGRPRARLTVPRPLLDDPVALRDHFLDLAVRGQVAACIDLAVGLARSGEVALACDGLLRPVQAESGRRWQTGEWTVVDEHLVTGIVEESIGALETEMTGTADGGRVALVCPPGEWHATAARLAALAWRCHGWQVRFLGIGVPLSELRAHLAAHGAVDVLAVSCTVAWHLPRAVPLLRAAHELGVPTLLGGAGTGGTADRARRLGATGWALGALPALEVLAQWRAEAPPLPVPVDLHPEAESLGRRRVRVTDQVLAAIVRPTSGWGVSTATLREDVAILVRSIEAGLQVHDPTLLDDVVTWMRGIAAMRGLPATWPALGLEALLDALPDDLAEARRDVLAALRRGGAAGASVDQSQPGPGTPAE